MQEKSTSKPANGGIDYDKLHEVFSGAAAGGGLSEKALAQLLGQRDKWFSARWFYAFNRSGGDSISEDDFNSTLESLVEGDAHEKAEVLMRVFDEDGDGILNAEEFESALEHIVEKNGLKFTPEKIAAMKSHGISGCDKNGDGAVCVDDLTAVLDGERVTRNSDMFRPANPKLRAALFPPKKPESSMLPTRTFAARKKELMLWMKSNWAMALLLTLYVLVNVGLFAQAFARYTVICLDTGCTMAVPFARGFGAMLNLDMAVILLPMSRTLLTIIRHRFSRRWFALDEMISIHKFMGYTCMFASLGHTIGHMCNYILTLSYTPLGLMTRAGLTGHILLYGMAIILVGTFEIFRRGRGEHEIFHLSHYHWIIIFPCLLIHGPIFWIFFLIPGGLFLFEYCSRILFRFHAIPVIVGKQLPEGWENDKIAQRSRVLQLEIQKPWYSRYKPGQYYFINFRQVSWYEWHPFSVTSTPGENLISFHIRALGDWTNDLFYKFSEDKQYGRWMAEGKKVEIRLDGPYGAPCEHFGEFKYLMLVATGIGVTPMVSILRTIKLQMMKAAGKDKKPPGYVKICLYWMNREQRAIEWFIDLLLDLQRSDQLSGLLELNLYITGLPGADISNGLLYNSMRAYSSNEGVDVITDLKTPLIKGRPRWADIFQRNGEDHPDDWGVFFTGPPILAEELNKQSKQWSKNTGATFHFFKENF